MFIYTFGVNECSREGVCVVTTTRITIIKTGLFSLTKRWRRGMFNRSRCQCVMLLVSSSSLLTKENNTATLYINYIPPKIPSKDSLHTFIVKKRRRRHEMQLLCDCETDRVYFLLIIRHTFQRHTHTQEVNFLLW